MKRLTLFALLTLTLLAACSPAPEPVAALTDTPVPSAMPEPTTEATETESPVVIPEFYPGDAPYSPEQLSGDGWRQAEELKATLFQQLVAGGTISPNESGDYEDIVRFHPVMSEDNSFGSVYMQLFDDAAGQWEYMVPLNMVDGGVELLTLSPSDGHEIVIAENADGWPVLGEDDELWSSAWLIVDAPADGATEEDSLVLNPSGEWVSLEPLGLSDRYARGGATLVFNLQEQRYEIVEAEIGKATWILVDNEWEATEERYVTAEEITAETSLEAVEGYGRLVAASDEYAVPVRIQQNPGSGAKIGDLFFNRNADNWFYVKGFEFIAEGFVRPMGYESLEEFEAARNRGEVEPRVFPNGLWGVSEEVTVDFTKGPVIVIENRPESEVPQIHAGGMLSFREWINSNDGLWPVPARTQDELADAYFGFEVLENGQVVFRIAVDRDDPVSLAAWICSSLNIWNVLLERDGVPDLGMNDFELLKNDRVPRNEVVGETVTPFIKR